jgi:predicted acyl esterase
MTKFYKFLSVTIVLFSTSFTFSQLTPTFDDIWIPMRDGDSLQADIYIPAGVDSSEVILIQTPYDKDLYSLSLPLGVGLNLDTQPFIWVIVDWRGFYGSNQANTTSVKRGEDGYDACDWIIDQVWHKDRIGTWGPSALGVVQYQTAKEQHPNHTCAVPLVAHPQYGYDDYFYGGVLEDARLQQLDALGYGLSPVIMANTHYNNAWQLIEADTWYPQELTIPMLHIGGWYDHNIDKMMDFYEDTRQFAEASVQDQQWMLVGPWVHGGFGTAFVGSNVQGELTYPDAEFKSDSMAWDFLEYFLLDSVNNWETTELMTYYDLGGNSGWQTSSASNIEASGTNVLYLDNNNMLAASPGLGSSSFVADPSDPSPTIGGATLSNGLSQGPYDQSSLDSRTDVFTFSTDPLSADVTTTGRISLDLFVSADQEDCDIAIRLVDVYPDGTNMLITDGIRRMRFRDGYWAIDEALMTPGEIYPVNIELPFTNYTWQVDHKIKIYVSGNHADRFDVNLQDGGAMYVAGTGNTADITIHHDATNQSKITFPGTNPALEISEKEKESIDVYPNPAQNEIFLANSQNYLNYSIIDLSGRTVQSGFINGKSIDVSELSPSVHSIIVSEKDGNSHVQKFLKK